MIVLFCAEEGNIYSFGSNSEGQLGIADAPDQYAPRHVVSLEPANYKMLTAGSDSSMALTGLYASLPRSITVYGMQ